jgi:hypothetical protein
MKPRLLLFSLFCFICSFSFGQSWLWGNEAKRGQNDEGFAIVSDKFGNGYLTGDFEDTLIYGGDTLYNKGANMYLVKYDPNGKVKWIKSSNNGHSNLSYSLGFAIATDMGGNIFVAGRFGDTISFGTETLIGKTNYSSFLVKYNSVGNVIWARQSEGASQNYAYGVATDKLGNAYLTGTFIDSSYTSFGSDTLKADKYTNIYLVKYDSNGNVIWAQKSISNSSAVTTKVVNVATDVKGNVLICGGFSDSLEFGPKKMYSQELDEFLVKFDANGNALWVSQGKTSNLKPGYAGLYGYQEYASSITTDKNGNAYVIGGFYGTLTLGNDTFNSTKYNEIYIAKYDLNGKVIWAKESGRLDSNNWIGYSISADTLNHFYISGASLNFSPAKYSIRFDSVVLTTSDNSSDGTSILVEFDSSGKALCGAIVNGCGDDMVAVSSDPSGQYIYLGGDLSTNYNVVFGPDTLLHQFEVPFVARWQPCPANTDAINELSQTNLVTVYPNPSIGKFTFQSANGQQLMANSQVFVYNMLGEKVYSVIANGHQLMANPIGIHLDSQVSIDLSAQLTGIYLYRITNKDGAPIASGKLIISR